MDWLKDKVNCEDNKKALETIHKIISFNKVFIR